MAPYFVVLQYVSAFPLVFFGSEKPDKPLASQQVYSIFAGSRPSPWRARGILSLAENPVWGSYEILSEVKNVFESVR